MDKNEMKKILVSRIAKKVFDNYVFSSRSPKISMIGEEISWFANEDFSVIGTVVHDRIDNDYAAIMLGKDEIGKYRAFNLQVSITNILDAEKWLENTIKWYTGLGKKVFPQGEPGKSYDLFSTKLEMDKQHPYFVRLNSDDAFIPAKRLITNIMPYFIDIDGNFIEQFQTTGFDSRIWELYLFSAFIELGFEFDRRYNRPDFLLEKYREEIAVEAVTVGRKDTKPKFIDLNPDDYKKIMPTVIDRDEIAIRFGSPLYSKLCKKYWELEQVRDKPFILSIADFHEDYSMVWSSNYFLNYLYGYEHDYYYKDGKLIIVPKKIEKHVHGDKEIPSGFFDISGAENISGVMFSSSGTISKFNRLAMQCGLGTDNIKMYRYGIAHKHDENTAKPNSFSYEVTTDSNESWVEGLNLYHNPNAKNPIDPDMFPGVAHHFLLTDGNIKSIIPQFHPYSSITMHMRIK